MTKNVGNLDRSMRLVLGLALIGLALFGPQTPWGWVGLIPLATALVGSCPAYTIVGIKTCKAGPKGGRRAAA